MQTTSNVEIDRKTLFVPAVAPVYETLAPFGYALIRAALGLILMPHGFAKRGDGPFSVLKLASHSAETQH